MTESIKAGQWFESHLVYPNKYQNGMTLRDYFAAKAMNGIMMYSVEWNSTGKPADQRSLDIFKDMARDSYAIADAMLEERIKQ